MGCVVILLATPFLVAFRGYVLHMLWGWFVTRAFDIPSPGVALCVGLSLVGQAFCPQPVQDTDMKDVDTKAVEKLIASGLLRSALALAFGWVVRACV